MTLIEIQIFKFKQTHNHPEFKNRKQIYDFRF